MLSLFLFLSSVVFIPMGVLRLFEIKLTETCLGGCLDPPLPSRVLNRFGGKFSQHASIG